MAPDIKTTFPKSCSQGSVEETMFLRSSSTIGCLVVANLFSFQRGYTAGSGEIGRGLPIQTPNAEEHVLREGEISRRFRSSLPAVSVRMPDIRRQAASTRD